MRSKQDYRTSRKAFRTLCIHFFFTSMFLLFVNTFTFQFTYQPWFLYPTTAFAIILFLKYIEMKKIRDAERRGERMGLPSGRNRNRLDLIDELEFRRLYNEKDLV